MKNIYFLLFAIICCTDLLAQTPYCDSTLWQHVYGPGRLQVIQPCTSITGTVKAMLDTSITQDGDFHIYILPDTQYDWMIHYGNPYNWENDYIYEGDLNVEEVCVGAPPSSDTIEANACHNFRNSAYLPNLGEYVRVVGPFCYDTFHGWNEMHPVTSMEIVNPMGISDETNSFLNDLKVFPQPANYELNLAFGFPPHEVTYIRFYNALGEDMGDYQMAETSVLTLHTGDWPAGEYIYTVSQPRGRTIFTPSTAGEEGTLTASKTNILKSGKFTVVH